MAFPFPDPTIVISGVSAVLKAIDTWVKYRDSKRAADAFKNEISAKKSLQVEQEAHVLLEIIPFEILERMTERTERCWTRYKDVLDGEYLPSEVDEATEAVKACICRELNRIVKLGQQIPPGKLTEWWNTYCQPKTVAG